MTGRNILMYFRWSRPDEEGAPLGDLDNRFGALFELRRLQWPKYEALADPEHFNQGIAGFLDNVLLQNYALFRDDMRIRSGNAVRLVERLPYLRGQRKQLLDGDLLGGVDILIIVSFESQRTAQHPNQSELTAIRQFLDDPGHTLFVSPHHDIGNVEGVPLDEFLARQEMEFHHHGDLGVPGQQRLGSFAKALLRDLGVSVTNRFGLRPAKTQDGSPAPIHINSKADRFNLLQDVKTFHLHPHLPHLEMLADSPQKLDVLVEQSIDPEAPPHPFISQGREDLRRLAAIQTKRLRRATIGMRRHPMDFNEWRISQPPPVLGQCDSAGVRGPMTRLAMAIAAALIILLLVGVVLVKLLVDVHAEESDSSKSRRRHRRQESKRHAWLQVDRPNRSR